MIRDAYDGSVDCPLCKLIEVYFPDRITTQVANARTPGGMTLLRNGVKVGSSILAADRLDGMITRLYVF